MNRIEVPMIPDESRPIFIQLAETIENDILSGALPEETQVPSTNEFAAFHRINPATAGKAVNLLATDGVLYKKRGIGMFVSAGSRAQLLRRRRERFSEEFIAPLLAEAEKLGLGGAELLTLVEQSQRRASTPPDTAPHSRKGTE